MTELVKELLGTVCVCLKGKGSRKTFCYECYRKLPKTLQNDLYKSFGEGYEEAYREAIKVLEGLGRVRLHKATRRAATS